MENAGHLTHMALSGVDLAIIAVYFLLVFSIGMYFARRERTSADYFLASRNVGWFAIGASLFVSNISTEHFIGLAGSGASSGLAVGHFEWLACLIVLLLGWVFVPFYLRSNVFTMPEFLELRFSRGCAVYLAGVSILAYIFTKISVHLYAAGIVLERVVGWNPLTAALILVIATGVYTIAGGLAAVIYTDLVQTLILIAGAVMLTLIGLDRIGDIAYPMLVINLLPAGLVGIMIAALMAALMGAMSSVFNSASTLVTLDFYKKISPQANERQLVNFGRAATGVLVLLGVLWVPFIRLISSKLFIYLQAVQAYISPPIAVCFIFGILWTRVNGTGALTALQSGFVLGSVRFVFEVVDKSHRFDSPAIRRLIDINFLHYAVVMFVVCAAILVGVSLMTPPPERRKLAGLTFATVDDKIETIAV